MEATPSTARITHARKSKRGEPAKLVQSVNGDESEAPFNPKLIAENLNLWRLNSKGATYYAPTTAGDFREMSGADARRFLAANGIRTRRLHGGELLSDAEKVVEYACNHRLVDFAGPLAGHKSAVYYTAEGNPFVVLGGPHLIAPKKGD